jgi:hypothetical protein
LREAVAVLVAVPFLVGAALAPAEPDRDVAFRFTDPEIVESSGLVVEDGLVATVNDSGDSARVFAVDPGTGDTVGTTTWPGEPDDVEALAPGRAGEVWVGDIGDNQEARDSVTVTPVPIGRGDLAAPGPTYELVYPDGPHDAEALLAHPRTGRLFVVTKGVLGGTMYAAPSALRNGAPNRLEPIGDVPGIVTDGAFFPDARHVILRNYGRAFVYTFPSMTPVGDVDLPPQRQGEGIAVAPDGTVYASSEGVRSPVLRITLPASVQQALAAPPATQPPDLPDTPTPSADPNVAPGDPREPAPPGFQRDPWQWALGGLLFVGALVVLLRALRPPR